MLNLDCATIILKNCHVDEFINLSKTCKLFFEASKYCNPRISSVSGIYHERFHPFLISEVQLEHIDDYKKYRRLHVVAIQHGTNIDNLLRYKNIYSIDLSFYKGVDCANLVNIKRVNLMKSIVYDLKLLTNVTHLNISGSPITDISQLVNLRELIANHCSISHLPFLPHLYKADLSHNVLYTIDKCNAKELNLSFTLVSDVSMLGNVNNLNLSYCKNVIDVSALSGVKVLDLTCCTRVRDVSTLGNLHTLKIKCTRVRDVSMLGNVKFLNIKCTDVDLSDEFTMRLYQKHHNKI